MVNELVFDSLIGDHPGQPLLDFESSLACVCGVRNAADARLVDSMIQALEHNYWQGTGIHTPVQWLMWQTGLARATARKVLTLAARANELPATLTLLREGLLSLDQAHAVARYTPTEYEESVSNVARSATVNQIIKAIRTYGFDIEKPRDRSPSPGRSQRGMSYGYDDDGDWWARIRLTADEGVIIETALNKSRDALHDQARETAKKAARAQGLPDSGTDKELGVQDVSSADAFIGLANSVITTNANGVNNPARNKVHLHLEIPTGESADTPWIGELHGGTRLPQWLRRQLCCDADITTIWEREGIPLSTCRSHRTPPDRLRRLIEHRDNYTCVVPGCDNQRWLQTHHITHWEDEGPTTTDNLACICPKHHRMHHQGLLGITGNPDIPTGTPGGLEFTNQYGKPIPPAQTPTPPAPGDLPDAQPYQHPTGEHLHLHSVYFNRAKPADEPEAASTLAGSQHREPAA